MHCKIWSKSSCCTWCDAIAIILFYEIIIGADIHLGLLHRFTELSMLKPPFGI